MVERIKAVGVTKQVGPKSHARTLWKDLDLEVNSGEMVCITGASGSGKSTLLNCLGLLDTVEAGTISLNGTNVTGASERARMRMRRENIGYLFQDYALIDNDTVEQNVKIARTTKNKNALSVEDALEAVGLGGRGSEQVFQFSGGEQQRVAMARLLVRKPSIVLADEPTASLDRRNAAIILGHLRNLAHEGAAVVVVSHDPWVIEQCSRTKELKTA
ncbi:ABC-type antimicrobial peptide transport system, ATPase component [Corynebacterium mustelae]|uniref:ABC-type antimicrobial peptide transport system, ATPase component n=1 Tax=Corynebacterium mustelae TaxID=571915 RepID=A0A0G3H1P7_9CORY|nr:ATP-binding cassette domain-containing protein [Corynebacterium mustelae]AKK07336.1 ABC-type antimicrobial peptide transport system, ATPase component [Corynebacterium mustelae]